MNTLKDVEANIWKYYTIEILSTFWFIIPISILYLQSFGLSYSQIALFEIINAAVVILLDIPTGVFADFIGKKWSTFLGCIFWVLAMFTIGLSSIFSLFLLGFFFWGVGDAFFSGALQSLFYDTLKRTKKEKEFLKIKGKLMFAGALSLIIGSISGAYLYGINKRLPWILFGLAVLLAAFFVVLMKEPFEVKKRYSVTNQIEHMRNSIKFSFTHKEVRWLIIFSMLASMPIFIFVNLMEQPYLINVGYSIASLGIIFAITRGIIGLLSTYIYKVEERLGEKMSFYLITLTYVGVFILLGLVNLPHVIIFVTLLFFARDYKRILIEKYINKHIQSNQRATVLSIQNFLLNAASIVYVLIGGFFLDLFPLNIILISLGIITSVTALPYLVIKYRDNKV